VPLKSGGYQSETSKCRSRLAQYCVGYGLDLGFGGDPITPNAIRVDQPTPYANTGSYPVQLGGDAANLHWFADNTLDFLYSSHLLEDFDNCEAVLREWWRVLKPGGMLIIFCPDEQVYRKHCAATGQTYNTMHKHADFSLEYVKKALAAVSNYEVVHECPLIDIYSWELVCKKG
jgi:predicted SAM-dependent methyltransferase